MIPLPLILLDDELSSMQDNDLYQSVNEPLQQKAEIKPRSSKFQSFNKFPELFDTCLETENYPYDYPSITKNSVDQMIILLIHPTTLVIMTIILNLTKQKLKPHLTNLIHSLVIMIELSKLNTTYDHNQKRIIDYSYHHHPYLINNHLIKQLLAQTVVDGISSFNYNSFICHNLFWTTIILDC